MYLQMYMWLGIQCTCMAIFVSGQQCLRVFVFGELYKHRSWTVHHLRSSFSKCSSLFVCHCVKLWSPIWHTVYIREYIHDQLVCTCVCSSTICTHTGQSTCSLHVQGNTLLSAMHVHCTCIYARWNAFQITMWG